MFRMDLTDDEARFLRDQLARHVQEVEDELVHTEYQALQRSLRSDFDRLQTILGKLDRAIADQPPP